MAFDKKYYNAIKKFTAQCIYVYGHSPMGFYNMIPELIKSEDYESVQAIKDVLAEWMNKHVGTTIAGSDMIKIPDWVNEPIHCHISYRGARGILGGREL